MIMMMMMMFMMVHADFARTSLGLFTNDIIIFGGIREMWKCAPNSSWRIARWRRDIIIIACHHGKALSVWDGLHSDGVIWVACHNEKCPLSRELFPRLISKLVTSTHLEGLQGGPSQLGCQREAPAETRIDPTGPIAPLDEQDHALQRMYEWQ